MTGLQKLLRNIPAVDRVLREEPFAKTGLAVTPGGFVRSGAGADRPVTP